MSAGNPSRRAVFAGMALAPVMGGLAASPPLSAGPTPFAVIYARHKAFEAAFEVSRPETPEQEEAEGAAYSASVGTVDVAEPTNWTEFVQKLEHVLNDRDDDLATGIIGDAKRLVTARW